MLDAFKIAKSIPELDSGYNVNFAQLCLDGKALHNWIYSLRYEFSSMNLSQRSIRFLRWPAKHLSKDRSI